MTDSTLQLLKEFSAGKHSWRAVVRDLRLWDFEELRLLMEKHGLPLPTLDPETDRKNIDAFLSDMIGEGDSHG